MAQLTCNTHEMAPILGSNHRLQQVLSCLGVPIWALALRYGFAPWTKRIRMTVRNPQFAEEGRWRCLRELSLAAHGWRDCGHGGTAGFR